MEFNNDYLYHCRGCQQHDEEYPSKEIDCEECGGTGFKKGDDCSYCMGYGEYAPSVGNVQNHRWARADAYGIYTGLYCDDCYDDPDKYTYRKDNYFDPGYAGESLEPEDY